MAGAVTLILTREAFVSMFRPLVGPEGTLADLLLEAATNRIRREFAAAGSTLDETDAEVKLVVLEVVRAAIRNAVGEYGGLSSFSVTTDDATEQRSFVNPDAALDFTEAHWRRLGLDMSATAQGTFPENDY